MFNALNQKSQGMKKFLCMTMLMLAALTASAMAQTKAPSPPEQDIVESNSMAIIHFTNFRY